MTNKRKAAGEDRISELPDDVLCHILSFLPSEKAIATCLLSTRWRSLWTMVPAFDFECTKSTTYRKINKFSSLRRTQRITRFHIRCNTHHCWSGCVKKWVSAAIDGKVEQLSISLCRYYYVGLLSLPTLFTCTTVVTLNLKLKGSAVLCIPPSVHLPSLKTFHIDVDQCVPFDVLKNLLYGSPALKLFHLKEQGNPRFKELKILRSSRSIQLLECKGMFDVDMLDLVIESDCDYDFIPHYLDDRLENVVKAKAYITVYDTELHFPLVDSLVQLYIFSTLRGLRNVEFLSFSDFRLDTYENDEPFILDNLPQFQNLVQLQLHLKDVDSMFMELPEKCPKLQVVEFDIRDDYYGINKRCRYHISGGLWEHDLSIVPV